MYQPDWSFERQMRAYDRELSVRWVPHKQRWGLFRRTPSAQNLTSHDVLIHLVEGPGGCYQPLDQRTLDWLRANDTHRRGRAILDELFRRQEILDEAKAKARRAELEDLAREIHPIVQRELGPDVGTRNIPREDVHQLARAEAA